MKRACPLNSITDFLHGGNCEQQPCKKNHQPNELYLKFSNKISRDQCSKGISKETISIAQKLISENSLLSVKTLSCF